MSILYFLLLFTCCVILPGYGMARRFVRPVGRLETLAYTLGIGVSVMSYVVFTTGMLTRYWVRWPLVVVCATVVNAIFFREIFAGLRGLDRNRLRFWCSVPKDPYSRRAGIALACVAAGFLLNYDGEVTHLTCINHRVALSMGVTMGEGPRWTQNNVGEVQKTGRVGAPMQIMIFPALAEFAGFRLSYVFTMVFIFLFAYLAGAAVIGNRNFALIASLVLMTSPPILGIEEVDQNLIVLSLAFMCFALLFRGPWSPFMVGMLFGLLYNVEQIVLPSAVAILYWAWRERATRWRRMFWFGAGVAVTGVGSSLYHLMAYGRFFFYPAVLVWGPWYGARHASFPHHFLWYDFELETMLNFPYSDVIVRSPYNAFPTFLLFPLHLLEKFGVLLAAVTIIGFVVLWRKRRPYTIALALFLFPYFTILQFQENWSDILKMRLLIMFYALPTIAFGAGLSLFAVKRFRKRAVVMTAGLAAGLAGAIMACASLEFPQDERQYLSSPNLKRETPAEYAMEVERYTTPTILPLPELVYLTRWTFRHSLYAIPFEWSSPAFQDQPIPLEEFIESKVSWIYPKLLEPHFGFDPGKPQTPWKPRLNYGWEAAEESYLPVILDLSQPLLTSQWLRVAGEDEDLPELQSEYPAPNQPVQFLNKKLPWTNRTIDIMYLSTYYGRDKIQMIMINARGPDKYPDPPSPIPQDRLLLQLNPAEPVTALFILHHLPSVSYVWNVEIRPGKVEMGTPSR